MKIITRSAVNFKKTSDVDELYTCHMVMWYWSADVLFWQLSMDHNMDVQYERCKLTLNLMLRKPISGVIEYGCHVARHHWRKSKCDREPYCPLGVECLDDHEKSNAWFSNFCPCMILLFLWLWGSQPPGPLGCWEHCYQSAVCLLSSPHRLVVLETSHD